MGRDGVFHLVAFLGPGVIAARALGEQYRLGIGIDAMRHKPQDGILLTQPRVMTPGVYHAVAEIDPAPGTSSMDRDLRLMNGGP